MKQSKWPDFLFTIVVRFLCGIAFGCLAWFFSYRFILRAFSHNNTRGPLIWLVVCGLAGGSRLPQSEFVWQWRLAPATRACRKSLRAL